jgi:WD40 repeat protein
MDRLKLQSCSHVALILFLFLFLTIELNANPNITHKEIPSHEFDIYSLDISKDGKLALSGSYDQTVKLWDLEEGKQLFTFDGHTESVKKVLFSNDEKRIYSASRDKTIIIWDMMTASAQKVIQFQNPITTMIVNKDNTLFFIGDSFGRVTVCSVEGEVIKELDENIATIKSLALSEEERYLISASENGDIAIWETEEYNLIYIFTAHDSSINVVKTTKDSSYFATAGSDGIIKAWNFEDLKLIKSFYGHTRGIEDLVISNDSRTIISSSNDDTIRIWEYNSQEKPIVLKKHRSTINALALSKDNSRLISAGLDQQIIVWDVYLYSYASSINTIEAYDKFMKTYPQSPYNGLAMKKIFNFYKQENSIEAFSAFIERYKSSIYISECENTIYEIAWQEAKKVNTIEAYNNFIFQYPKAPQVKSANDAVARAEIEKYIETIYGEDAQTFGADITRWTNITVLFFTESSKAEAIIQEALDIVKQGNEKKIPLGYYIVANRLFHILNGPEFKENGTVRKFFLSEEYKDFESELKRLQSKTYTIHDFI